MRISSEEMEDREAGTVVGRRLLGIQGILLSPLLLISTTLLSNNCTRESDTEYSRGASSSGRYLPNYNPRRGSCEMRGGCQRRREGI